MKQVTISICRQLSFVAIGTAAILMIPLIAMQFTPEVNWTPFDFFAMGLLVMSAGVAYVLISRLSDSFAYRVAVGVAVAAGLFLLWMNGAVGLIGSENNPANLLYLGVLAIGVIGAVIARFRPRGMMHALFATAIAQTSVPFVAMLIWSPQFTVEEAPGVIGVLVLNTFFAALFAVSAFLFRRASEHEKSAP